MKLKPVKKLVKVQEEKQKKEKPCLPKGTYDPEFEPLRFLVSENPSFKDATKSVKKYIEISVKRYEEYGLPYVFLQMYQEADIYTGYLKGKSVHFPLEMLYTVMEKLEEIDQECEKRKIE